MGGGGGRKAMVRKEGDTFLSSFSLSLSSLVLLEVNVGVGAGVGQRGVLLVCDDKRVARCQ